MERQCGAKTKAGTPCRRAPMLNGRCHKHGGPTPRGPASPQFKHGRYSRYLPSRLGERYAEALADPDLLALWQDVALVDARLSDLLARVDSGESGQRWQAAQKALAAYMKALGGYDPLARDAALAELAETISTATTDHAAWSEIARLLDQRARLVEGERRRLEAAEQKMTVSEAMALLAAVTETVRLHVEDQTTLGRIAADLGKLLARPAQPGPRLLGAGHD